MNFFLRIGSILWIFKATYNNLYRKEYKNIKREREWIQIKIVIRDCHKYHSSVPKKN